MIGLISAWMGRGRFQPHTATNNRCAEATVAEVVLASEWVGLAKGAAVVAVAQPESPRGCWGLRGPERLPYQRQSAGHGLLSRRAAPKAAAAARCHQTCRPPVVPRATASA